jgi:predicted kinase
MIGITGVGNSTIARELARHLGLSVIAKNRIRVKLREEGPGFTPASTDAIHYAMLTKVMRERGNAVLDSDFIEKGKRRRLERFSRRFGAEVVYLHLVCDRDVMLERMLRAHYNPKADIFKSVAIAVREHTRRYPWHYRWSPANGGEYIPRRPPVKVLATINTTDSGIWKQRLRPLVKRLRRM